ncbi:MAG: DNA-3-methyladenine glycosylase [Acidobacteria bacterium]|nr:DNA-3-methyladenine glycosylase [Acidobacteriota bacterium]MCA1609749.1 DNA-3-methyladenine glycosylase [Acidobacteriota bacterium]
MQESVQKENSRGGGKRVRPRAPIRHGVSRPPDPRLRIEPEALGLLEPPRSFYRRETISVAKDLLGSWLARRFRGKWYGARIVETEAYLGIGDAAAHTWNGRRTARVEPMYADGGHLYVFLVYGMHHCANVVTREEGTGQAVLLRAGEPPGGLPARLLSGPGKLCAGLGITVADSGRDLAGAGPIRIFRRRRARRSRIIASPRIGVDYAGDAAAWPLRFFISDSDAVSGKR